VTEFNIAYYWRKMDAMQETDMSNGSHRGAARALVALLVALVPAPARAVTPDAEAFMAAVQKLAPVLCERRSLRRELAMAQVENDAARAHRLRERMQAIARDPETARLDERVDRLHRRLVDANGRVRDPDDLRALSAQQLELFARCE